jgi:hypothetical protein
MIARDDVETATLRPLVEKCFATPPPRGVTNIFGKPGVIRRDALWFGRYDASGFFPLYRTFGYGDPGTTTGVRDAVPPARMPQWMEDVLDDLSRRHNLPVLNHVVLHRYVDGGDTIGMHHDKTMDLHQSSTIVSLSLGGSRDFRLGPSTFPVHDGDVVLIPYETNRLMKHGVPPRANASTRYSLTARTVHTYSNGLTHRVVAAL